MIKDIKINVRVNEICKKEFLEIIINIVLIMDKMIMINDSLSISMKLFIIININSKDFIRV